MRATVLGRIASYKDEGDDYSDLPVQGPRVDRAKREPGRSWLWTACPKAFSTGVLANERRSKTPIVPRVISKWKEKTEKPTGDTDDEVVDRRRRHHLKGDVFKMLRRPTRRDRLPLCCSMKGNEKDERMVD